MTEFTINADPAKMAAVAQAFCAPFYEPFAAIINAAAEQRIADGKLYETVNSLGQTLKLRDLVKRASPINAGDNWQVYQIWSIAQNPWGVSVAACPTWESSPSVDNGGHMAPDGWVLHKTHDLRAYIERDVALLSRRYPTAKMVFAMTYEEERALETAIQAFLETDSKVWTYDNRFAGTMGSHRYLLKQGWGLGHPDFSPDNVLAIILR